MVTQHTVTEPNSLTDIKNHPHSICINCLNKYKDCSFVSKTIHFKNVGKKYSIKYYIKGCSNKMSTIKENL